LLYHAGGSGDPQQRWNENRSILPGGVWPGRNSPSSQPAGQLQVLPLQALPLSPSAVASPGGGVGYCAPPLLKSLSSPKTVDIPMTQTTNASATIVGAIAALSLPAQLAAPGGLPLLPLARFAKSWVAPSSSPRPRGGAILRGGCCCCWPPDAFTAVAASAPGLKNLCWVSADGTVGSSFTCGCPPSLVSFAVATAVPAELLPDGARDLESTRENVVAADCRHVGPPNFWSICRHTGHGCVRVHGLPSTAAPLWRIMWFRNLEEHSPQYGSPL
jgi:hypothetical protein